METQPVNFKLLLAELKPRARQSHKGNYGHVYIVGGDYGYAGAPVLAALGALRVGAGLVTICTHKDNTSGLNAIHPEIMTQAIDDPNGLPSVLTKADVIVIGPGLGRSDWSSKVFAATMQAKATQIIDADGLYFLSRVPNTNPNRILTPHPGEAAMLLGNNTPIEQSARIAACSALFDKYGCTIVLKGAGTLVISPETAISECSLGNPGMATAGMGDLLSGVIAGLVAQGLGLNSAAQLGVCVHAMAGDQAALDGQRGLIATDLLNPIRNIIGS